MKLVYKLGLGHKQFIVHLVTLLIQTFVYSRVLIFPHKVRLVNGSSPNQGRVEVLVNDTWGTVCDDEWDLIDAHVICRQLGFERAAEAWSADAFGPGDEGQEILLDDLRCMGLEKTIFDCQNRGVGIHNCGHSEDVGVRCTMLVSGESCHNQSIRCSELNKLIMAYHFMPDN